MSWVGMNPVAVKWLLLQFIVLLMMDAKGVRKHIELTCSC